MTTVTSWLAEAFHLSRAPATLLLGSLLAGPLLAAGQPSTLEELKLLDMEGLMEIEITSVARHSERLIEAAAAIQVITSADIRRSGATTLPEVLRLAGNLHVAQRDSHGWAISARGFNTDLANKLLVLVDGRTVYTPLFSGVFWEAQDYLLEDIDRIEVISGPGGSVWGANAVNGVINIITRSAADTAGLHAEAGAGSEMERHAGLRFGGSAADDVHFRAYGKLLDHDQSVIADGSPTGDAWHKAQGGFRLDSTSSPDRHFTLQGDAYRLRQRVSTGGITTMKGANVLGRVTHTLSAYSDWTLQAYYDWTHLSDPVAPLVLNGIQFAPAGILRDELHTLDLDFQHRLALGSRQRIVWGLAFRHTQDTVTNAPGTAFFPLKQSQSLYSAFVQDEVMLRDALSLTLGTKLEHNDDTGLEVEPSIRLQWQAAANQTVWAAISRAVRTPSRVDRDLRQAAPPLLALLYGNPDFKSEKVIAHELGYRAQNTASFNTAVSAYYNLYRDLRSTSITPATLLPFYFENNLTGHSYGMEFAAGLQAGSNWTLHAAYNLLQTRLRVKQGEIDLSNARNETADPQQQITLRSSFNLPHDLELDAALRWVDTLRNNRGPDAGSVPAYMDLNVRIAWRPTPRLEVSIAGHNLLQERHPEYGFPDPARAEVERSVSGKLVWRR